MIAAIYIVVKGPKKLQTQLRMAIALVVTALLFMVPGAILRMGDPHTLGAVAGRVALLAAVIAGLWHTRSLMRASSETPGQPLRRFSEREGEQKN